MGVGWPNKEGQNIAAMAAIKIHCFIGLPFSHSCCGKAELTRAQRLFANGNARRIILAGQELDLEQFEVLRPEPFFIFLGASEKIENRRFGGNGVL